MVDSLVDLRNDGSLLGGVSSGYDAERVLDVQYVLLNVQKDLLDLALEELELIVDEVDFLFNVHLRHPFELPALHTPTGPPRGSV